jgi:D-3-phosphoglycerate dehydrogenase
MKVYLSENIDANAYKRLADKMTVIKNFEHPEDLDAIIVRRTNVTRKIIAKASKCKIIAMHGVGLDTIDLDAAYEYGLPVLNVPGESAQSVAELVVAYIMCLSRKFKIAQCGLQQGRYSSHGPAELIGTEIYGKTIGLVGFGNISKKVSIIMNTAFNCKVFVYSRNLSLSKAQKYNVERITSLSDLFSQSDFISISVPLTDETRNMINTNVLDNANPNLILVDTSRGGIINEKDLYLALLQNKISGAGMDVSVKEPMDPDNPLLMLENFMITPHIGSNTVEARRRVGNIVVNNVFKACGIEATA